jgi:hypothetical protein
VKSEERKNTRFPHLSTITREDVVSGVHYGANMYNYSKDGLYFEADYLLVPEDEIFIGIENSPYASAPGVYECYRAKNGARTWTLVDRIIMVMASSFIIPTIFARRLLRGRFPNDPLLN